MKYQSLKKRISTASILLVILFFAALDLESKALYESSELDKESSLIACPVDLGSLPTPQLTIVQSQCLTIGGIPSGGEIIAPTTACPVGTVLEYATNENPVYTTTIPTYNQTTSLLINTRCYCLTIDTFSIVNEFTTMPADCSTVINTTIPTMSQWGLIIFGLLILNIGVVILYRLERLLI